MILEFCGGGDFAAYLKAQPGKKISEERSKHWIGQLKDGLCFLRSRDILHRDLVSFSSSLRPLYILLLHANGRPLL